jgi:hypothetical protein
VLALSTQPSLFGKIENIFPPIKAEIQNKHGDDFADSCTIAVQRFGSADKDRSAVTQSH